jgi:hypothetical protein
MLQTAFLEIQSARLDAARVTLAQVIARLPDSDLGLEAARGTVAIYNARRIERADATAKPALVERAREDLRDSRWAVLFD